MKRSVFLELNAECLVFKQHGAYLFVNSNNRKLNLLSFGEEAEEEEKELGSVKLKIKSSHDVLNDPRLLKDETLNNELVIRPFF